ncbi:MAG: MBL fold metallo-hydrolase [Azoarcus sp.]|nr:MBL fold metallo-hydrolase [Azoarcus sp.]
MQNTEEYSGEIVAVEVPDGERSHLAAVYLIIDHGRVAVIDTASNTSVPHILAALARRDVKPEAVEWVILTHLHLDHAGGAGSLMCALPRAKLVVHPIGVPHLVNPVRLWEATVSVYGAEQAFRLYGRLVPVDEARMVAAQEGLELALGERTLCIMEAPGHARHHIVVWDEPSQSFFTGDAFGLSCRKFDVDGRAFIFPTTSFSQFDPHEMLHSIGRMLAFGPRAMFLSHHGRVGDIERLGADTCRLIYAQMAVAEAARGQGLARHVEILAGLEQLVREECVRQQWALDEEASLEELRFDLSLNAQGLGMWLDRSHKRELAARGSAA